MGSLTPRGSPTTHHNEASDVAFDQSESLGTPDKYLFGAQQPAHMNRYRRFGLTPREDRRTARGETWLVTPSFRGTLTPCLSPVSLAHRILILPVSGEDASSGCG